MIIGFLTRKIEGKSFEKILSDQQKTVVVYSQIKGVFRMSLQQNDVTIFEAIEKESNRQHTTLELIASENFVSEAVLEAMGTVITNKYAEGYPGKRYYGGCEYVDIAEDVARDRLKELFGAEHANVQPHSGAQANMAVFYSFFTARGYSDGNEPFSWWSLNAWKPC